MTRDIKTAIKKSTLCIRNLTAEEEIQLVGRLRILRNKTTRLVDAAKDNYFKSLGRKLTDAKTGIKA